MHPDFFPRHHKENPDPTRFLCMAAVLRAIFGYLFLVFIVRVAGRRPGKQMTPFEFVLIFFMGGLTLTFMVGDEASLTNALCQIATVGVLHYALVLARRRFPQFALATDGAPLILLADGQWYTDTLTNMRILPEDVMAAARDKGASSLDQVKYAILERNGEISIIQASDETDDD
jgi:uncharacterized membrane protein YcaP (DUF421 family)